MKPTNNEGKTSAELVEGRARTKENDVESHTHPTQSGARVSQGLDGVRQKARANKQEQFTALLHHLTVDLLQESYYALQRGAAPEGFTAVFIEERIGRKPHEECTYRRLMAGDGR